MTFVVWRHLSGCRVDIADCQPRPALHRRHFGGPIRCRTSCLGRSARSVGGDDYIGSHSRADRTIAELGGNGAGSGIYSLAEATGIPRLDLGAERRPLAKADDLIAGRSGATE